MPRPVPKPVGAPPAESCLRLKGESWWTHMQSDLKNARDLEIASYCMDEARLFSTVAELLLACKVNLYIDKEMLADATKEKQHRRVRQLHRKGAHVYVLKGLRSLGSFHSKPLIINRRIMFFGGANVTDRAKSDNRETTFRATRQVVEEILEDAADWRAAGALWDGKF